MNPLEFRDPVRANELSDALARAVDEIGRSPVSVMHVCGSHEQAIARFGLRASLPRALNVIMGPGCPVCITDMPEIDEGIALALQGVRVATYGDMLRVPGSAGSLADARAAGAQIDTVYSISQAVDIARQTGDEVVFFATGFETTAVATAAVILNNPPPNFSVLSAHKYIPPVMEIVAEMPGTRVEDAIRRLHGIADFFLLHDREIEMRCDDSVVSVIAGQGTVVRRSRGYVPRSIPISSSFPHPVLACGAVLKNTFCIGSTNQAWLGPHIGDLENLETFDSYTHAIDALQRFLQVEPAIIAHDLHPDYLSTRYALARPEVVKIGVQHHHAHIVSAMAEHHLDGPVIGIAYDGTGFGTDGTSWGGEVMVATPGQFERLGTFRPIALAGGDRAIREPWRIAVALALDAYEGDVPESVFALMKSVAPAEITTMRSLIDARVQTPLARGVGRYFDAFGAFFLDRRRASFEGQLALEWNQIADRRVRTVYAFDIRETSMPWEIDLRPAFRAAVEDRQRNIPVAVIAAAFHNTLVDATALIVRKVAHQVGRSPVVASGGCFQNARLAEGVSAALFDFDVRLHEHVPPGDGGIALGQALVAKAICERG